MAAPAELWTMWNVNVVPGGMAPVPRQAFVTTLQEDLQHRMPGACSKCCRLISGTRMRRLATVMPIGFIYRDNRIARMCFEILPMNKKTIPISKIRLVVACKLNLIV